MTKLICKSVGKFWVLEGMYQGLDIYVVGKNESECIDKLLGLVKVA